MIRTAERKYYDLYDGDRYMGRYDIHGICDITGASVKYMYRASGGALLYKKRYTIQDAGCEAVRILHKEPIKNFPAMGQSNRGNTGSGKHRETNPGGMGRYSPSLLPEK